MDMYSAPIRPDTFGERASLALARLFLSPIKWDGSTLPAAARLPDANLLIGAGDGERPLDRHRVLPVAAKERCDVLATYVEAFRGGHVMHFDIALHRGGKAALYPAYRFWVGRDDRAYFVPETGMEGPAVALLPSRLAIEKQLPFATAMERTTGLARGQALLYGMIWKGTQYVVAVEARESDRVATLTYPDKLIVLFPMHQPREYRRPLSAVDDALVVHRRPDGEWLLELRRMAKLGPRRYASYLRQVAADLEAGYTLVIVDRDEFLEELTRLALANATAREREATERAAQIIDERRRFQTRNHDEALDIEHQFGRSLIASRERRTRAYAYEKNRNTLNCRFGVPTPRSEQLWHSIRSDLCDVRTEQQGMIAWQRWTQRDRPDMPKQIDKE